MEYEWDESKQIKNRSKHKIGFESIEEFNWSEAVIVDRSRHLDGEKRFAGIGPLEGKLYTIIFTRREGRLRIISLRRSNNAEEKAYEKTIK